MDLEAYTAAVNGQIDFFRAISSDHPLNLILTSTNNTILHVYITSLVDGSDQRTSDFVRGILNAYPSMIQQVNDKHETLLHLASRYGHDHMIQMLIHYCANVDHDLEHEITPVEQMLRMMNNQGETALHEAVRFNHVKAVNLLLKEDPHLNSANNIGETPIYIAAEKGFESMVTEILENSNLPLVHGGPLGRTALHAAIIRNEEGTAEILLKEIVGISKEADNEGWTPLHLAVFLNRSRLTKLLLDVDRDLAYMKDIEGRTPLHIAATGGKAGAIESIISKCPDCSEVVDKRGWNMLHFLMKGSSFHGTDRAIDAILKNSCLRSLLNEKNEDGDTPLHYYYSKSFRSGISTFVLHSGLDKNVFNNENLSPFDEGSCKVELKEEYEIEPILVRGPLPRRVMYYKDDTTKVDDKDKKKKREQLSMLQNLAGVHLVVAVLITTVSYAACIAMPGGFMGGQDSRPGSAVLRRSGLFKTFILMDTTSMVFSSCAVFIHLWLPYCTREASDTRYRLYLLKLAFWMIIVAMVAMGFAFVMGTCSALVPSMDIVIPNSIIGATFLLALFFLVYSSPIF